MSCLHRGPYLQRGRGIGGTLSSMFKRVIPAMQVLGRNFLASPITQQVLNTAKRSALQAGLDVTTDALEGKDMGESLSKHVTTAKNAVSNSLLTALKRVGSTESKAKKVRKTNIKPASKNKVYGFVHKSKKRQKRHKDLFDSQFE